MRKLLLLLALSAPANGLEIHSKHCLHGCPIGSPSTNDLIIREIYIMSSNDQTKMSDWVAYRVTKSTIGKSKKRSWMADPLLADEETLEPLDYMYAHKRIGVDRGHQVPLASFSGTDDWQETNYMSNITPQRSDLNQGPWNHLEGAIRRYVLEFGAWAYVMTGPLFKGSSLKLPHADEPHVVPSGYWKIVTFTGIPGKPLLRSAFIMPQEASRKASYCEFEVSVDEVEKQSGLRFFHNSPKHLQVIPSLLCDDPRSTQKPAK